MGILTEKSIERLADLCGPAIRSIIRQNEDRLAQIVTEWNEQGQKIDDLIMLVSVLTARIQELEIELSKIKQ